MNRSRRHRHRLGHRLHNWFRSYVLFQGNRPFKPRKARSAWKRRWSNRYARFRYALQRFLEPKRRKQRRPPWWIRRWNSWKQSRSSSRLLRRFSMEPIERRLERLSDRLLTWLFSNRRPQKAIKTKEFPRDIPNVKLQQQIDRLQVLNPIQWVFWLIDFGIAYFLSRPLFKLIPAIPALLLLLTSLWFCIQASRPDAYLRRKNLYEQSAAQAMQNNDLASASVFNRTLLDLDPDQVQYQLQRAEIEVRSNHDDKAQKIMQALAFTRGSGQAAAWLVERDFSLAQHATWSPEKHAKYRHLLQTMVSDKRMESSTLARLQLIKYLEIIGDFSAALTELEPLLDPSPQYLGYALDLANKGQFDKTLNRLLPIANRYYRDQLERNPANVTARFQLAKVLDLLGEFVTADALFQECQSQKPEVRLQDQMQNVWLARLNRLSASSQSSSNLLQRWRTIHLLIRQNPSAREVIEATCSFFSLIEEDRMLYAALLTESRMQNSATDSLPLLRCLWAIEQGNQKDIEIERNSVYRQGIDLVALLNSLALGARSQLRSDVQQALKWSNQAVREFPSPENRKTRGELLFRLKRYEEAAEDLNFVAQSTTLDPPTRHYLSEALRIIDSSR